MGIIPGKILGDEFPNPGAYAYDWQTWAVHCRAALIFGWFKEKNCREKRGSKRERDIRSFSCADCNKI